MYSKLEGVGGSKRTQKTETREALVLFQYHVHPVHLDHAVPRV